MDENLPDVDSSTLKGSMTRSAIKRQKTNKTILQSQMTTKLNDI
ncbi:MAG: hypothetical protein ACK521_11205 [bacterium]